MRKIETVMITKGHMYDRAGYRLAVVGGDACQIGSSVDGEIRSEGSWSLRDDLILAGYTWGPIEAAIRETIADGMPRTITMTTGSGDIYLHANANGTL